MFVACVSLFFFGGTLRLLEKLAASQKQQEKDEEERIDQAVRDSFASLDQYKPPLVPRAATGCRRKRGLTMRRKKFASTTFRVSLFFFLGDFLMFCRVSPAPKKVGKARKRNSLEFEMDSSEEQDFLAFRLKRQQERKKRRK